MAREELNIVITGNSKNVQGALNKTVSGIKNVGKQVKKQDGLLKTFKKSWMGITAGAVALSGVALAAKKTIEKASELQEETNKFNVVFRTTANEATKMRDNLVDAYGMSRIEATRALASIQDFLVPMGIAREKATDLSGEFNKLAVDLGSFNNQPTAQVMEAIKSALAGMSRPMRQFGVDVSETTLKQMALDRGIKLTNGKLDSQSRAMLILEKIQKDSADAMGDFTRSQDSFANQSKIAKAAIEDLQTEIGEELLPIVTKVIKKFNTFAKINESMKILKKSIQLVSLTFQAAWKIVLKPILLGFQLLLLPIIEGVQGLTKGVIKAVSILGDKSKSFKEKFKALKDVTITGFKNIKAEAVDTASTIAGDYKSMGKKFLAIFRDTEKTAKKSNKTISNSFNDAAESMEDKGNTLKDKLKDTAKQISIGFVSDFQTIKKAFSGDTEAMINIAQGMLDKAGSSVSNFGEYIGGAMGETLDTIGGLVSALKDGVIGVVNFVIEKLNEQKEAQQQVLQDALDTHNEIAAQIIANYESKKKAALDYYNTNSDAVKRLTELNAEEYQKRIDDAEGAEKEKLILERKIAKEREAIQSGYDEKIKEAKRQQFEINKNAALIQLELDRAEAESAARKAKGLFWSKEEKAAWREMQGNFNTLKSLIQSQTPAFQTGGSFIVPPGFENDSFPMRVSSGEKVDVTPANQTRESRPGIYIENLNVSEENIAEKVILQFKQMGFAIVGR